MTQRQEGKKAGDNFEFLAAALFQGQGFLIRRSLPLGLTNSLDATDVDVFGVKFVYPFQAVRLICDCKDRTRSQAIERVFWSKGLASCINASEVYVFVKSARLEVVQFAQRNGVRVLTEEVFRELTSSGAVNPSMAYSHADQKAMTVLTKSIAEASKTDKMAKPLIDDSLLMFHGTDPFEDLNVCMDRIDTCAQVLNHLGPRDASVRLAYAFALSNFIVALAVQLLSIAADTMSLTTTGRRTYILQRLTYGSMPRAQAHAIMDAAVTLAQKSITLLPGQENQEPLPMGETLLQPPKYAEDVVGLVERAIANPKMYHPLPLALDFTLFDGGLYKGRFDHGAFLEHFNGVPADIVKATRNVFAFLRTHTSFVQSMVVPSLENPSAERVEEAKLAQPEQDKEGAITKPIETPPLPGTQPT